MGNKNKQTKGIWIPEEIKVDKKLDWTNKALLSEIYSLCELPDGCIASDNHFGKLLGIKRLTPTPSVLIARTTAPIGINLTTMAINIAVKITAFVWAGVMDFNPLDFLS